MYMTVHSGVLFDCSGESSNHFGQFSKAFLSAKAGLASFQERLEAKLTRSEQYQATQDWQKKDATDACASASNGEDGDAGTESDVGRLQHLRRMTVAAVTSAQLKFGTAITDLKMSSSDTEGVGVVTQLQRLIKSAKDGITSVQQSMEAKSATDVQSQGAYDSGHTAVADDLLGESSTARLASLWQVTTDGIASLQQKLESRVSKAQKMQRIDSNKDTCSSSESSSEDDCPYAGDNASNNFTVLSSSSSSEEDCHAAANANVHTSDYRNPAHTGARCSAIKQEERLTSKPDLPKANISCQVTFQFPSKFLAYLITCNEMTSVNAIGARHNVRIRKSHSMATTLDTDDASSGPRLSLSGLRDQVTRTWDALQEFCEDIRQRTAPLKTMQEEMLRFAFDMLRNVDPLQLYKTAMEASGKKATHSSNCDVPSEWEEQQEHLELKQVGPESAEFNKVQDLLQQSLPSAHVQRIERIQNKFLWTRYRQTRDMLREKNGGDVQEQHLFHGTRTTAPEKIFRSEVGFDMRFSSKGSWGEANYFATKAKYSDAFAHTLPSSTGQKQMFLAQVLIGDSISLKRDRKLRMPPTKPGPSSAIFGDIRYDTVNG
eukprot:scpid69708/ scgid0819/ Probable poly [ADP-ribose] polymerase DDB_G0278045